MVATAATVSTVTRCGKVYRRRNVQNIRRNTLRMLRAHLADGRSEQYKFRKMKADDPYETMADLATALREIKAEEAKILSRKVAVQAEMREVAKIMACDETDESEEEEEGDEEEEESEEETEDGLVKALPKREQELLRLLVVNPSGDYNFFAVQMYGKDTTKNRANVASKFSNLKKSGHVIPLGVGKFSLTEKGGAAI